jgi:hypothetical protein
MDACATTVTAVQERFDRLEADFNALSSASESEAVTAITRSQDELHTRLEAVNENVRELTRRATTSACALVTKDAEIKSLEERIL